MSENNYGALMMKSALSASIDIDSVMLPGIYPVPSGNTSSPDPEGGILTIYPGPIKRRTFTSNMIVSATSLYNYSSKKWGEFELLGQVSSFLAMRLIKPGYAGQRILLASHGDGYLAESSRPQGGGEFISVYGTATDDGGMICVPDGQSDFYWLRVADVVKTEFYGIKPISYLLDDTTDYSVPLQKAIDYAVKNKLPLDCHIPTYGHDLDYGIFISTGIDITGLSEIRGQLTLFLDSSKGFTGLSTPGISSTTWAVINLNGTFDSQGLVYNTPSGKQNLGHGIHVRQFAPRGDAYNLSGQCHVFSGTNWDGALTARNFYGHGVYLGSCWDWTGNEIRTYGCGTTKLWGNYIGPYPEASGSKQDECNNFFLSSLFVHDNYDKANFMQFTGGVIGHIHQERTIITSTTAWTDESITVSAGQTDYPYLNNFVYVRNGEITQWGVYEGTSTQISNGSPVVTLMRTLGTSIGVMNASGQVALSPPLSTTFGDGNTFDVLVSSRLKINPSTRISAGIVMCPENQLLSGSYQCDSTYAAITKLDASGAISANYGRYGFIQSTGAVSGISSFVDRLQAASYSATGPTTIGYMAVSGVAILSGGSSSIRGGNVGSLVLSGDKTSSRTVIDGVLIGVLTCSEAATISNCVINTCNINNCAAKLKNVNGAEFTYTGAATLENRNVISDCHFYNNFQINSYFKGSIRNVEVGGEFQTKGDWLAVTISDCQASLFNMDCNSGYFLLSQCQGGVSHWRTANNKPSYGCFIVRPDNGVWQRYINGLWEAM